ncbi:MAG: HAMP domain-containing protein [bacterium]|nr:HAMP domain-containing protein [bacterium]
MKIKQKLMLTFLPMVIIPLLIISSVSAYFLSSEIEEKIDRAFEKYEDTALLIASDTNLNEYIQNLTYEMEEEAQLALNNFKQTVSNIFRQSEAYDHVLLINTEGKGIFYMSKDEKEKTKELSEENEQIYQLVKELKRGTVKQYRKDNNLFLIGKAFNDSDELVSVTCLVLDHYKAVEIYRKRFYRTLWTMGAIMLLAIAVVVFLTIAFSRKMVQPISEANNILKDIAEGEGDLTRRLTVTTNDEIGEMGGWFNRFVQQIYDIIVEVRDVSAAIKSSATDISGKNSGLDTTTTEQTDSLADTVSTINEFLEAARENAENSGEANKILEDFNTNIQEKRVLVENVTGTMQEISSSSNKINNIVNVINDISFQTNLLALNAAVEAARAGEAGRGFAVVASEVRNLAQKTAESSKTIQSIVSTNVDSTNRGMNLVHETSDFFESIFQVVTDIVDRTQRITQGSARQLSGVESINQSINHIERLVTHIQAMVDELRNSETHLVANADKLQRLVDKFNL